MNPITHLLISWTVAEAARLEREGPVLVTGAGVLPDIDGLGIVAELATRDSARPLLVERVPSRAGSQYRVRTIDCCRGRRTGQAAFSQRRSGGDDLSPAHARRPCGFSRTGQVPVAHPLPSSVLEQVAADLGRAMGVKRLAQRASDSRSAGWGAVFGLAKGILPVELVSKRADRVLIATLRRRFGEPRRSHA